MVVVDPRTIILEHTNNNTSHSLLGLVIVSNDRRTRESEEPREGLLDECTYLISKVFVPSGFKQEDFLHFFSYIGLYKIKEPLSRVVFDPGGIIE